MGEVFLSIKQELCAWKNSENEELASTQNILHQKIQFLKKHFLNNFHLFLKV